MIGMKEKVSVVVPIYKVEKYLKRCIDSILAQSYQHIEVILVNDGSPDQCGAIAEEYSKEDPRVKVIHKKNGGLSDARNAGMENITGEYTLFVDSDDWLGSTIIEKMVQASHFYEADIVQSAFYYAYNDYLLYDNRYYSKESTPVELSNQSLMSELVINEKVKNFAWGKLYKSDLIKDLRFEKGVLFEDVFWAHHVMKKVKKYVILHQPMYYYFQRNDSIVSTYSPKNLDIIKGLKERHSFLEKHYQDLLSESFKIIFKTCLTHYHLLLFNRKKDKGGFFRKEIKKYIKNNYKSIKESLKEDPGLKRQLLFFSCHPFLNIAFLFLKKVGRKLLMNKPAGLERIEFKKD